MATKRKKDDAEDGPSEPQALKAKAYADLLMAIVDRVGWPGLLVIMLFVVMFMWASPDQKKQFIDLYVLGKGIVEVWPIVILSGLFAATVVAQYRIYGKKVAVLEAELTRVGNEKSELQQELTLAKLKRGYKQQIEGE